MTTYRVTVTRDSDVWAAVVDDLPPHVIGATDVEHFAELEPEVRDLVAALTDSDLYDFDLDWRIVIDGRDVTEEITMLGQAEAALTDAAAMRDNARNSALKALADTGLSQAAIGDVLGVSHQRVHQLLKAS
jgi:DNA-directed RNA polymerase specialized sigma subunit